MDKTVPNLAEALADIPDGAKLSLLFQASLQFLKAKNLERLLKLAELILWVSARDTCEGRRPFMDLSGGVITCECVEGLRGLELICENLETGLPSPYVLVEYASPSRGGNGV